MTTINLPKVTAKTIRSRVGERSFTLGQRYARDGSIFNARRQGPTLKARCQGSRDEAYHVQATLGDKGIANAECSCPVGGGGHCKHVAALLLTGLNQPDEFTEVQNLEEALGQRSKSELITLIKQMLRREPDLELLLETPADGGSATADPETYRRQATAAFRGEPCSQPEHVVHGVPPRRPAGEKFGGSQRTPDVAVTRVGAVRQFQRLAQGAEEDRVFPHVIAYADGMDTNLMGGPFPD